MSLCTITRATQSSLAAAEYERARIALFRPTARSLGPNISSDSIALRVRRSGAGRSRLARFIEGPLSLAGGVAFFALLAFVMWGPQ